MYDAQLLLVVGIRFARSRMQRGRRISVELRRAHGLCTVARRRRACYALSLPAHAAICAAAAPCGNGSRARALAGRRVARTHCVSAVRRRRRHRAALNRLYFASAVLRDGRVVINGGEYNFCVTTESNQGAIFNPVTNTWKSVPPPNGWSEIGDGQSVVLTNGTYMLGNCCTNVQALFDEKKLTWTQTGPANGKDDVNSEEGWTLLRNGEVLVVNVSDPPYAQVYNRTANEWESAGELPVNLITGFEIGPQTLRPNNTVFVAGATGATAILNVKTGVWTQGPSFPIVSGLQLDVADGPSALLVDGTVMIPASPGLYNAPATFFLFKGKKLKTIAGPPDAPNDSTYNIRLLVLPTGQILETDYSGDVEIYTSNRAPEERLVPEITSIWESARSAWFRRSSTSLGRSAPARAAS